MRSVRYRTFTGTAPICGEASAVSFMTVAEEMTGQRQAGKF